MESDIHKKKKGKEYIANKREDKAENLYFYYIYVRHKDETMLKFSRLE